MDPGSRSLFAFILTIFLGVTACGDYHIRLPGGYDLVRVYGNAFTIIFRGQDRQSPAGDVVVHATVDRYAVLDGLVVGHVSILEQMSMEEREVSKPGYFLLNTKTHEVQQGLDRKAWVATLLALGIEAEPKLKEPSRFDNFLKST